MQCKEQQQQQSCKYGGHGRPEKEDGVNVVCTNVRVHTHKRESSQ
jgi:hypothetical protein